MTIYETADGHNHWHLRAAMRYALYDSGKSVEVAPSQKVGFCLIDSPASRAHRACPEDVRPRLVLRAEQSRGRVGHDGDLGGLA